MHENFAQAKFSDLPRKVWHQQWYSSDGIILSIYSYSTKMSRKNEFAVVEFDDSCDESQTLVEVIPSKWLLDNNNKCKYPPKKDKLKTTRLVMSKMNPGRDWNIYNLQFHNYYSTYNTALKAAKTVLEGEVARSEAETDYDHSRKRKKNRRYISSEDEEVDNSPPNIPRGTSSEVPAPDFHLSNKLKVLLKNKSMRTSAICQQKETSVGKLLSRNESRVKPLSLLKSTHNTTLDKNPMKQHSLLNEVVQQRNLSSKDCSTQMSEKFMTAEPLQSKKTKPVRKLHRIFQHLDKENCNSYDVSQKCLSPQLTMDDNEPILVSDSSSMSTLSVHMHHDLSLLGRGQNAFSKDINKAKSFPAFDDYESNNEYNENFANIHFNTSKDKSEDSVLREGRISMSVNNENRASPNSPPFQGLSNADRDLLTTILSHLKKLHGPVVSNLDRDLLRDVSSKLDIVLMNQRRILNEIFPDEAIIERPENCPPLPLRDEKSFQAFNEFLKDKIAYSQFVSYLNAHILDDSDQWNAAICLMSIILHNELARQVSWKGTKGVKIPFYGTKIKEALFCAIMGRFKDQSLKIAEKSMKCWLNTSGQRK